MAAVTTTRHFFKVLIPGFHQRLNLPSAVSHELEAHESRVATLQSCIGTWKIRLSKNAENNLICFDDEGWSEFVESHALHVGDFLVFEHSKNLHFNVLVFGPSACEKEFNVEPKKKKMKMEMKKEITEEAPNFSTRSSKRIWEGESPYFVKKMTPSFADKKARVSIPREFMSTNELGKGRRVCLRRIGENGREWIVDLSNETNQGFRNRMCGEGWQSFYTYNQLKIGDTCVFNLRRRFTTPTTIFFDVQIS